MSKYLLNLVNNLTILIFFVCVSIFSKSAIAGGESGVICKAANLSQALTLGLGHNQNGANNDGTGDFFVVCPIAYETVVTTIDVIQVGIRFPAGGGTVNCTARGQHFENDMFTSESLSATSTTTHGTASVNISPGWSTANGLQSNATVVCALGPGESIKWLFIN